MSTAVDDSDMNISTYTNADCTSHTEDSIAASSREAWVVESEVDDEFMLMDSTPISSVVGPTSGSVFDTESNLFTSAISGSVPESGSGEIFEGGSQNVAAILVLCFVPLLAIVL